jgi:hypothetical protein
MKLNQLLIGIVVLFLLFNTTLLSQSLHVVTDEKGRYGYADEQGAIRIPCKYKDAFPFEKGIARVKKGSKYGLMNTDGEFILKPSYDEINSFAHGVAKVRSGKKYGIINTDGVLVLPVKYDNIAPFEYGVAVILKGKKMGLISQKGNIILPVEYAAISNFNKYGKAWINKGGKIQRAGQFKNYVFGGKFGIINVEGIVVPPIYSVLGELTNSISSISSPTFASYFYYNPPKTDCKYLVFSEKSFKIARGLLNEKGEVLIPSDTYNNIAYPHSNMITIQKNVGKKRKDRKIIYGYINLTNNQEILLQPDFIGGHFINNVAVIKKVSQIDQKTKKANTNREAAIYSLINKQGDVIFDKLNVVNPCKENKIVIVKDALFGVVDVQRAELIIPFGKFEGLKDTFSDGSIGAMKAGKWGLIDSNQKTIIPFEYADISNVQHGYFVGKKYGMSWGLFDVSGKQIIPCKYTAIRLPEEANSTYTWVKRDALWYSYNIKTQKESNNAGYAWVSAFKNGIAQASMIEPKSKNNTIDAENNKGNNASQVYIISQNGTKLLPYLVSSSIYEKMCDYVKNNGGKVPNKTVAHRLMLSQSREQRKYQLTSIIPDSDWDY